MAPASHERLRRHFESLDADADGYLEREEWEAPARRILQSVGEPGGTSPRAQAVVTSYQKMWDYLSDQAGTGTCALTLRQFKRAIDSHVVKPGRC